MRCIFVYREINRFVDHFFPDSILFLSWRVSNLAWIQFKKNSKQPLLKRQTWNSKPNEQHLLSIWRVVWWLDSVVKQYAGTNLSKSKILIDNFHWFVLFVPPFHFVVSFRSFDVCFVVVDKSMIFSTDYDFKSKSFRAICFWLHALYHMSVVLPQSIAMSCKKMYGNQHSEN